LCSDKKLSKNRMSQPAIPQGICSHYYFWIGDWH